MSYLRHLLILTTLIAVAPLSAAQVSDYSTLPNSPAYEKAAEPLRNAPPSEYKFSEARLSDVLQLLAEEAGIAFFSLPNDSEAGQRIVTFTIHSSPFLALETLGKANGVSLIFENGIWYMRPENDTQLIGRVYQIRYNTREMVTSSGSSGGGLGSSGGGLGGSTGGSGGGIDLQGGSSGFQVEPSKLLEDIRELLGIPTTTNVILAPQGGVDAAGISALSIPATLGSTTTASGDEEDIGSSAKVIWNSDSNTLYVVATRQQHQWIEGYLAASDKQQEQIEIEVKFVETSRNPTQEFGIDWSGMLSDGYDVSVLGDGPEEGQSLNSSLNLSRIGDLQLPSTAIINFEDLRWKIRALETDSSTRTVSYPRLVVTNNREAMFRSVINQPVLDATASTTLGTGATTTQSVSYLPIGTVVNILPRKIGEDRIQLNISLTVSNIIGTEIIGGNPYPIASSRVYNAPVEVISGYTVAIGGLDEASDTESDVGLPVVRRIPIVKTAFNSRNKSREQNSLLIFITPKFIDTRNGGLPDEPQSVVRSSPQDPRPPTIYPQDNSMVMTIDQLPETVRSLRREVDIFMQIAAEGGRSQIDKDRVLALEVSLRRTVSKVADHAEQHPESWESISQYQWQLMHMQQQLREVKRQFRGLF